MDESAKQVDSAMAAVLKLDNEPVEALCRRFEHLYPGQLQLPWAAGGVGAPA